MFFCALIGIPMALVSCKKDFDTCKTPQAVNAEEPKEIVFTAEGPGLDISTKAVSEINGMTGFYVMATKGTSGAESLVWSQLVNGSGQQGSVYTTGKYWPSTNLQYHFYACISEPAFSATGATVTVNGKVDVVCAYLETPDYNEQNALVFDHIMGRIGTFTLNASTADYTLSGISASVTNAVKQGTYNIRTGAWSGQSAAENVALSIGQNDFLLVPGNAYSLSVTFTMTKGDYVATFTKTATFSLEPGKITNITANVVDDPAVLVQFTYSTRPWTSKDLTLTVE